MGEFEDRHSRADPVELIADPARKARREGRTASVNSMRRWTSFGVISTARTEIFGRPTRSSSTFTTGRCRAFFHGRDLPERAGHGRQGPSRPAETLDIADRPVADFRRTYQDRWMLLRLFVVTAFVGTSAPIASSTEVQVALGSPRQPSEETLSVLCRRANNVMHHSDQAMSARDYGLANKLLITGLEIFRPEYAYPTDGNVIDDTSMHLILAESAGRRGDLVMAVQMRRRVLSGRLADFQLYHHRPC